MVLLLACQLPLLIGTQALSFGVLHVRDLIEKLMIGVLLLLHDVIDVLRMELLGIKRSHLLVKCHAIGQSLMICLKIMVLYVKSLAFTFRQLIELVFAHLIESQVDFVDVLLGVLLMLLRRDAVWSPLLLGGVLVDLSS